MIAHKKYEAKRGITEAMVLETNRCNLPRVGQKKEEKDIPEESHSRMVLCTQFKITIKFQSFSQYNVAVLFVKLFKVWDE